MSRIILTANFPNDDTLILRIKDSKTGLFAEHNINIDKYVNEFYRSLQEIREEKEN